jgi:DUF1365 family protein
MPMAMNYRFRLTAPGQRLLLHIENRDAENSAANPSLPDATTPPDSPVFDATLMLERRDISTTALTGVLVRYPLMTLQVITAIHYQAFKLWWRGCPIFLHPRQQKHVSNSDLSEKRGIS